MEPDRLSDGPRVSVIMPCRNGLPFLTDALRSLQAQTYENWELLFVDGASTDGSVEAVRARFPDARILAAPDVPPPGAARNRAAEIAEGSLLAFLDSDDLWHPQKLARQVEFLAGCGADLVYSDCQVVDRDGHALGLYLSRHEPARGEVFEALLSGNFVPLPTILVTRELFERSGGFSEHLRSAGDYDWLLRAARHGRFDYQAEPLADYRLTPGSLTEDFRASYRENLEVLSNLADTEGGAGEKERIEAAASMVLWRWTVREALEGGRGWLNAAGLLVRAIRAASGPLAGVGALVRVFRDGLRGVALRGRMLRARRPRP